MAMAGELTGPVWSPGHAGWGGGRRNGPDGRCSSVRRSPSVYQALGEYGMQPKSPTPSSSYQMTMVAARAAECHLRSGLLLQVGRLRLLMVMPGCAHVLRDARPSPIRKPHLLWH